MTTVNARSINPTDPTAKSVIADCLRKWMAGVALDIRERAIVDAALAVNRADQLLRSHHVEIV